MKWGKNKSKLKTFHENILYFTFFSYLEVCSRHYKLKHFVAISIVLYHFFLIQEFTYLFLSRGGGVSPNSQLCGLCVLNLHPIFLKKHVVRNPGLCREAFFILSADIILGSNVERELKKTHLYFTLKYLAPSCPVGDGSTAPLCSNHQLYLAFLLLCDGEWVRSRTW